MSLSSPAFIAKCRRSSEPLTPQWLAYKEFFGGSIALIDTATSEADALRIAFTAYCEQIFTLIRCINPDANVDESFIKDNMGTTNIPYKLVELFFSKPENMLDVSTLIGLYGKNQAFDKEIRKMVRPYIALDDASYAAIEKQEFNYFLTPGGTVVSFGNAGTYGSTFTYALFPLIEEFAAPLRAQVTAA